MTDKQITMSILHNSSYNTAFSPQASTPKQFTETGSLFKLIVQAQTKALQPCTLVIILPWWGKRILKLDLIPSFSSVFILRPLIININPSYRAVSWKVTLPPFKPLVSTSNIYFSDKYLFFPFHCSSFYLP